MRQLELDDLGHVLPASSGPEDDDVVHPVQELGPEVVAQFAPHPLFDRAPSRPSRPPPGLDDVLAADVRGHDDHRVPEVHHPALPVGQAAVIENLEQDVEDVGMGLFDLVEQDHAVGPAADRLGQLAALLIADVSRRRADHPGHRVLLHVLRHVEPDHGPFVVEEELGQRPRRLGLPHAGRAQKDERAGGPVRVLQAGPAPPHRIGDGFERGPAGRPPGGPARPRAW